MSSVAHLKEESFKSFLADLETSCVTFLCDEKDVIQNDNQVLNVDPGRTSLYACTTLGNAVSLARGSLLRKIDSKRNA